MTYPEALRYFDSFVNYETKNEYDYRKSLGLERIEKLCALLGNPQDGVRSVHVAGTKGKGSTSAFIYYILRAAGYKVGLYTSPHLVSFRERIRVDEELISESDIGRMADALKAGAQKMSGEALSFFELYTALAYLYFAERCVDFAVYEVGLGGRLDATNIINPLVSVITPISYEHTDKLGSSLARIAFEKGGIIKKGITCVASPQKKEAEDEIKNICLERGSKLVIVGRD
ncbi:MAG TPA: Mur ligase family protein, partial [Candidatus Omnitrophota bacterium]|nr:Mur ligase family protein [Candidatus Omnitrophota bacterium]